MQIEHLTVSNAQLQDHSENHNRAVQHIRNNSNVTDNSRAQLVSSDVSRVPRRPSMTLEPAARGLENPDHHIRRGHARLDRAAYRPEERRVSNAQIGGIQQIPENYPRQTDRLVSNGHLPRNYDRRVIRHSGQSQSTLNSQRPVTEPGAHGNHPVEAIYHRHRDFQGVSSARTRGSNYDNLEDKDDRFIVPALPMPIAILCCVLNFIIPGFGSMAASVCVFCCAKTEDMTFGEKCGSCCTVFGIGVLQLLLVACFLIGWIWSCIWGITFIGMSASYYDDDHYDDEYTETNNPVHQGSVRRRTPLPTPQVVVDQPYPGIRYGDIQRERNRRREAQRRTRSRISLTPSNVIYPMRAPSNIAYNSPPPPYQQTVSPPPAYSRDQSDTRRQNQGDQRSDRHHQRHRQTTDTIREEHR